MKGFKKLLYYEGLIFYIVSILLTFYSIYDKKHITTALFLFSISMFFISLVIMSTLFRIEYFIKFKEKIQSSSKWFIGNKQTILNVINTFVIVSFITVFIVAFIEQTFSSWRVLVPTVTSFFYAFISNIN